MLCILRIFVTSLCNNNNLLTESEGSKGKYPSKVKTEVGYFPVLPERLRSVSFLLYGIVRL